MTTPVPARKVYWRGECLHCGRRQKVNKRTGKIGSHFKGGGDSYCPGVDLAPVPDSVREYIARPKVEVTYTPPTPEPRLHAVYKWAAVALVVLVVITASAFVGEVLL